MRRGRWLEHETTSNIFARTGGGCVAHDQKSRPPFAGHDVIQSRHEWFYVLLVGCPHGVEGVGVFRRHRVIRRKRCTRARIIGGRWKAPKLLPRRYVILDRRATPLLDHCVSRCLVTARWRAEKDKITTSLTFRLAGDSPRPGLAGVRTSAVV